jgi:hypothetical protein
MYGLALLLLHFAPYTLHDHVLDNPIGEGGQGALTLRFVMTLQGTAFIPVNALRSGD